MKRFINADILKGSIENGETLNNYAYANGNPISMVDPFGRCAEDFSTDMTTMGRSYSYEEETEFSMSNSEFNNLPYEIDENDGGSEAVKIPDATFTAKKLQHELKHSGDFGVTGNYVDGWKFSSDQMNFHLTNETKIK